MKQLYTLLFFFALTFSLSAQDWTGDGDGTSWDDAANWDTGIPAAGALVTIGEDVTITGTAANAPGQIKITSGATVTLNLSLTVGDGIVNEHSLQINSNGTLNIGAGNTITVLPPPPPANKNGISIFPGANAAAVNIAATATIDITGGQHAISNANATSTITNNGTITIDGPSGDGIKIVDGSFINTGDITIDNAGSDGIENSATFNNADGSITINDANVNGINNEIGATFTNSAAITINNDAATTTDGIRSEGSFINTIDGEITIVKADDDCIELTGGTFLNEGTINTTQEDGASADNAGIAVGTASSAGTFNNSSTGIINGNGGLSTTARPVYVYEMGIFSNAGTVDLTMGNDGSRFYSRGDSTNDTGGLMDLNDGRVNVFSGNFDNKGLILSSRSSSGVLTSTGATSTNDGFFQYDNSNSFSSGSSTDNGINLNDATETTIDAGDNCNATIANTSYTYTDGASFSGTSDATGVLSFPPNSFPTTSATLSTVIQGITVTVMVENICAAALLPIELLGIEAIALEKTIMIKWQTASELNNAFMAVEQSTDGAQFKEIGRIAGGGDSQLTQTYELEDANPAAGINYYRLRQVDFDGTEFLSSIVSARLKTDNTTTFYVYPTTLRKGAPLNISLDIAEELVANVSIVKMDGSWTTNLASANGLRQLDTSKLAAGMYQLILTQTNGQQLTSRFVLAE